MLTGARSSYNDAAAPASNNIADHTHCVPLLPAVRIVFVVIVVFIFTAFL